MRSARARTWSSRPLAAPSAASFAYGDDFLFEKLPVGTRVIYPPPPLEPLADPDQAIRYALLHPENADPLFAQLNPNMRVTIAIDDISLPLPPMRRPDIRERLLNQVMQTLADYGVDDVHLIIATSLHRRMTEAEIRRMVGEKAFKQFWPDRLYNFDAENRAELDDDGQDRSWRGSLALQARRRLRPGHLSQHQPGADGRRA